MSKVSSEIIAAFYSGDRGALPICVNDSVVVISGPHKGQGGAVISPESAGTDPVFLIEFGDDGTDAELAASVLRLTDGASQRDAE